MIGFLSKNGLPTLRSGCAACKILLRILFSSSPPKCG
ncbi:MAG: hypothetical protein ACI8W8_005168, partial [Rhodothermales bacterium]